MVPAHVHTGEWSIDLVRSRKQQIARFVSWSAEREETVDSSLRLSNRRDIYRLRGILDLFNEPWWGAVVYSCFDSEIGTRAVAKTFNSPVSPAVATRSLASMDLPTRSVQNHRTQPGHTGPMIALTSACTCASDMRRILFEGEAFHDRYVAFRRLRAKQWGRTTCYDLLVRTGQLRIGSAEKYVPDRAYLGDSTGPRRGHQWLSCESTTVDSRSTRAATFWTQPGRGTDLASASNRPPRTACQRYQGASRSPRYLEPLA